MRIPARTMATFGGRDRIEADLPAALGGIVTFKVRGAVVAKGEFHEDQGRLAAKIIWVGDDGQRRLSEWRIQKNPILTKQPSS
jgi:hypothetical protein